MSKRKRGIDSYLVKWRRGPQNTEEILVEYLEEWRFGVGRIKELSERIVTKWALGTEDCEGEGVYKLQEDN